MKVLMVPDYRLGNPYQQLLADASAEHGVKVYFPYGYRRLLPILRAVKDQPEAIDVLHLHWLEAYLRGTNTFTSYVYAIKLVLDIWLVRSTGTRIVWTIHNLLEHETKFPRLELWVRKIISKLSDCLILHNQIVQTAVIKQYQCDPAKTVIIPHGHYRSCYKPAITQSEARQQLNLPAQGQIYLTLGMLRPYKGIEQLLEHWQANQTCLTDSTLVIAGQPATPEYEQHLKQLIAKTERVHFYPFFVGDDQIHLYFSAADVVVLPYQNILTSGSAILAMTFGKPVIAPKLGSLPEVLGNAADLLYDANDAQGLSFSLQKSVFCDLEELSDRTAKACNNLNWEQIGEKTAQVYRQCLCQQDRCVKQPGSPIESKCKPL